MTRRNLGILCLLMGLGAASASGQIVQRKLTPGDVYCSGVVTREAVPNDLYLISGHDSSFQTIYSQGDYVFLNRGSSGGVKVDDQFQVIRKEKNPAYIKWFSFQPTLARAMGHHWVDVGSIRIIHVEANTSVGMVWRACTHVERGDVVRPWADRPQPSLPVWDGNRWPAPSGGQQAMVVAIKDFALISGMDSIIYTNMGSAQGVKTGDAVRFFRYQGTRHDTAYQLRNTQYSMWGFGRTPVAYKWSDLPRQLLGEGVVLRVSENAATVFVATSLHPIYNGDYTEIFTPPPPPPPPPPPAPAVVPNRPPTLSCSAERSSVTAGESVRVMARANDPDGDPLVYSWYANAGRITPQGESATWNSTGLAAGRYTINAQANDGKNPAADCAAYVEVRSPAAPPQASKLAECNFGSGSSRADNVCKRFLDDAAIRLKNDPGGRLVLVGYADPEEAGAAKLAGARAESARAYLQTAGIATGRLEVRAAGGQQGAGRANQRVDLVWVPQGASY
jgi:outer membrane protein OmpA-like peptidoglycan-associated protein